MRTNLSSFGDFGHINTDRFAHLVNYHKLIACSCCIFLCYMVQHSFLCLLVPLFCSADLPMSFEDRVAAVGIATQFQERSNEVFRMMEEETDYAKTQVTEFNF